MPDSAAFPDLSPPAVPPPAVPPPDVPLRPPLAGLMAEAAALEGGTLADVVGRDRTREAARRRQAAMWLAYKLSPCTLAELARAFRRHHTTVLYGVRAYERRLADDAEAGARGHALLTRLYEEERAAEPEPDERTSGEGARP